MIYSLNRQIGKLNNLNVFRNITTKEPKHYSQDRLRLPMPKGGEP